MNYEWHPLSMAFRMMTAEEYADFRPDIQVNGLRDSIVLFQGKILDGRNRYKACCETGIEPHFTEFDGTEEEAAAFVESKNAHRRHLSAEERLNRVREKLKADPEKSDRAIADETKAHRKTVKKERKKLEESGDIPATETRKGKDDKKRPATQPTGTRVPVESDTESGGTNAPPETTETASQPAQVSEQPAPVDSWGVPIQPHAEAAFAAVPKFQELIAAVRKVQQLFSEVAELEGGKFLTKPFVAECRRGKKGEPDRFISTDLDTALTKIKNAVPTHTVCPWNYVEAGHPEDCKTCHGLNWTTPLSKNAEVAKPKVQEVFGVHV